MTEFWELHTAVDWLIATFSFLRFCFLVHWKPSSIYWKHTLSSGLLLMGRKHGDPLEVWDKNGVSTNRYLRILCRGVFWFFSNYHFVFDRWVLGGKERMLSSKEFWTNKTLVGSWIGAASVSSEHFHRLCFFWTRKKRNQCSNFSVFSKLCSLSNCLWNHYDSPKESFKGNMVLSHSSCIGGCGDQFSCGKSVPLHFCNKCHAAGIVKQSRVP